MKLTFLLINQYLLYYTKHLFRNIHASCYIEINLTNYLNIIIFTNINLLIITLYYDYTYS